VISKQDIAAVKKPPPKKVAAKKRPATNKPVRTKSKNGTTQRIDREAFATALIANSMNAKQ